MSDDLNPAPAHSPSRRGRIARRVFVGSELLGGAGWRLAGAVGNAAERSSDK